MITALNSVTKSLFSCSQTQKVEAVLWESVSLRNKVARFERAIQGEV